MTNAIEVLAMPNGFKVYGRMGAVMRADTSKTVTYSNLYPHAAEYARMEQALAACVVEPLRFTAKRNADGGAQFQQR